MGRVVSARVSRVILLTSLAVLLMLVTVAFLAAPAQATTLEKLGLDQLAQRASLIVVARTIQTSVEPLKADGLNGSFLQTRVGTQVLEVLKGSPAATLSITVPGGQTRGISAQVDGMPTFTPGETSLLFLDKQHRVIGGFQGKLSIAEGVVRELGQSLAQVKGRIAKAVGHGATPMKSTLAPSFPSDHAKRTLPLSPPSQAAQALPEGFLPLSFVDGFESGSGGWTKEGSPTWAQDDYQHSVGSYSAYCIGSSYNGPAYYPANVDAVMYKGPFNLTGTNVGTFEFDLWLDSELGYDGILFGVSLDGQTYYPDGATGYSAGWDHIVMDLTAIETDTGTMDVTGQSQVWLVFEFISDGDDVGGPYEGAYVDQVKLTATAAAVPTIKSISPISASAGTGSRVTITGSTFGTAPGANGSVDFFFDVGETIPGDIVSWSDTSIVAEVPVGEVNGYPGSAGSGPVTVTDANGRKSAGKDFDVTFGYGQVKWSTPYAGFRINPNTADTASEKNLVDAAAVTWSEASAFLLTDTGLCSTTDYLNDGQNDLFWSSTLLPDGVIAATVPEVSGSTITEVDMIFNDYYPWGDGSGGSMDVQTVTLHEFGHWLQLRDLYGDDDYGKVMYGYGEPGLQQRTLAAEDQAGILWIYGPPPTPTITSVSPDMGPAAGGTTVLITGTGFKGLHSPSAVRFGTANAASYTVDSPTQITAVAPPGSGGSVGVTVTNAGGTSNQVLYRYVVVPSVRVMFPNAGPLGGGVRVQIFGQGFSGASAVTFGGVDSTDYEVVGDGLINVWPPAHAEGTVDVVITSVGGTSGTSGTADNYTYAAPPTITSIEPAFGPEAGGTDVVITGTNFVTGESVAMAAFDGRTTGGVVYSSTRMIVDAPPHAAGTVDIVVVAAGGSSDPSGSADDFTYKVAPTVTSVAPASGPTAGGTEVTITGTGFTALSGAGGVTFGGVNASSYTVESSTEISAVAPPHAAGVFDVVVTSDGVQSDISGTGNDFRFIAPLPVVSALAPQTGAIAGGMNVVITGNNFTGLSGPYAVTFGGTNASSYVRNSDTQITAVAPAHAAGTVDVVVTTTAGSSSTTGTGNDFTYIAPTRFEQTDPHLSYSAGWSLYPAPPTVGLASGGNYSRASASTSSATIYFVGERLEWIAMKGTSTGKAYVQLDSEPQQLIDLANPAGAIYQVNVWNTGAKTDTLHKVKIWWYPQNVAGKYVTLDAVDVVGHLVSAPPTITSLSPAMGSTDGGNSVVISGTGFTEVTAVTFGGMDATDFTVNSPTRITALVPPHAEGSVRVQVTTEGGTTADTAADNYTFIEIALPAISGLSPTSGTTAGGTSVIITGSGFVGLSGTSAVTFGGIAAKSYTVNSPTQITAVSPAHTAGPVRVQVTALGGTTADTGADDFTYVAPPVKVQQTSTALVYSGTWSTLSTASASGGSYKRSSTAGAYVLVPFNGTRLDWIATKGTTMGQADVYVDNVLVSDPEAPLDLYRSPAAYQQTIFSTGELEPGYHTVKIVRNKDSLAGKYINLDAVLVYGTLTAKTTVQQTDSHLLWSPSLADWTLGSSSYLSGGSYRYINKTGSVTINFTGVSLDILAKKAASYGIMKVTLDNDPTKVYLVNLYRSTTAYKQTVWSSGFLTPGDHSVTIEWTGTKSGSTGTTINLDAVLVRGVLR